eukprot:4980564-Prorocentrum_lima.AAC.1
MRSKVDAYFAQPFNNTARHGSASSSSNLAWRTTSPNAAKSFRTSVHRTFPAKFALACLLDYLDYWLLVFHIGTLHRCQNPAIVWPLVAPQNARVCSFDMGASGRIFASPHPRFSGAAERAL